MQIHPDVVLFQRGEVIELVEGFMKIFSHHELLEVYIDAVNHPIKGRWVWHPREFNYTAIGYYITTFRRKQFFKTLHVTLRMGKPIKRGNHEPPKITGAEIIKKAQLRSKLRYQGFLRPPTTWIEDPNTKFLSTAFPTLKALETGRPPQPPPAFGTTGGALPRMVGLGGGEGPGPFPAMGGGGISPADMNMGHTSINDFEDMGIAQRVSPGTRNQEESWRGPGGRWIE
jgi:hypothetical protein